MKNFTATLLILVSTSVTTTAQEKPKPNTLTPKEIADGWILLFDGETTFGWKIDGEVKVAGGELVLGGDKQSSVVTTTAFQDYEVAFESKQEGKGSFYPGWRAAVKRQGKANNGRANYQTNYRQWISNVMK